MTKLLHTVCTHAIHIFFAGYDCALNQLSIPFRTSNQKRRMWKSNFRTSISVVKRTKNPFSLASENFELDALMHNDWFLIFRFGIGSDDNTNGNDNVKKRYFISIDTLTVSKSPTHNLRAFRMQSSLCEMKATHKISAKCMNNFEE